jgi:hypothetical protein
VPERARSAEAYDGEGSGEGASAAQTSTSASRERDHSRPCPKCGLNSLRRPMKWNLVDCKVIVELARSDLIAETTDVSKKSFQINQTGPPSPCLTKDRPRFPRRAAASTYRPQIRSRVRLRPPGIGQRDRKITCQARPRSPQAAEKRWRRQRLCSVPKVVLGAKFNDGIEVIRSASSSRCRLIPLVTNIRR